jgi:NAD(P)-dependent dehydrogenase (short-subunit alcohol dehydrogenase family)
MDKDAVGISSSRANTGEPGHTIIERTDISRKALQGQVAVVTGAGQGIGRETARLLAYLGASVVIAEINASGRETKQFIGREGGKALFVQTDISEPASVEHLHRQACEAYGEVDILVNDAEAFTAKPLLDHSVEAWDHIFAVNLRGAFLAIKAFLPAMLERRKGVIITMESAEGMPYLAPYLASKVGLRSLALSLAQEVGAESGVSVYCFGAGMVETPGGMAAFRRLAPYYGVSLDEFIRQSAPGGHLISAELCATGLVGTILHARELHGQELDYTVGLSLLGLTLTGECPVERPASALPTEHIAPELLDRALTLNRQVEEIVRTNIREYEEQNGFVRPVVKRMFQQGTGLKVEEWLALAQQMTGRLERALNNARAGQAALDLALVESYPGHLRRMVDYLSKQEGDARGWIRDPAQLQAALAALRERKEAVQSLLCVLTEMRQQGTESPR